MESATKVGRELSDRLEREIWIKLPCRGYQEYCTGAGASS